MAIRWGFATVIAVNVGVLISGFLFGVGLDIPGLITVQVAPSGAPNASLQMNPFAMAGLAVLLSAAIWGLGRIRGRVRRGSE